MMIFYFVYSIVKEDLHPKTKRDCIVAEEKLFFNFNVCLCLLKLSNYN